MANNLFNLFGDGIKDSNAEPGDDDANSFFTEFDDFLNKEIGSESPLTQGNNIQSSYHETQGNNINTTNFSLDSIDDPINHTPTQPTFSSSSQPSTTNTNGLPKSQPQQTQPQQPTTSLSQHLAEHPTASNPNLKPVEYIHIIN